MNKMPVSVIITLPGAFHAVAYSSRRFFLFLIIMLLGIFHTRTAAQVLSNPFDFPVQLSGAFCDLRADHFHAGIDIRTKGSEGHALHAVQKGYISRVSVNSRGYGLAVYITHPDDSVVTVYGHLQRFNSRLTDLVREKQYEKESFAVDFNLNPDVMPVGQGEVIGYSGNSGSSGGPHLHFEVRDMRTNEFIDPLVFYKSHVPDTRKPYVRGLMVYPVEGKGMVNGSNRKQNIELKLDKNDNPSIATTIEAWGEIGLGIRAVDRMDGTGFSYGIKDILQTVDSVETYRSYADRFSSGESKYINSYTDYEEWSRSRAFYIKTFVEPGCHLRFVASRNSGKINISEERIYNIVITLTDLYGNVCNVPIKIKGRKQEITPPDTAGTKLMKWYDYNAFGSKGISLTIPRNSLYSSIYMQYKASYPGNSVFYSTVHTLHRSPVPLHEAAQLSIYMDRIHEQADTKRFGIVLINVLTGKFSWIGGAYRDGWIDAEISELGTYAVACDTVPPVITPVEPDKWREKKQVGFRITDALSGISTYRGEIDGKYALFEFDGKNAMLSYHFDSKRLQPGYHQLKLAVTDGCGNKSEYRHAFTW
ncbi:MAG: M23 family metallopeptidase [Tannerella sp.]|jgi:murein DD-endopeptidase MepM/ murein hydrolase activator NlpD|nr:M23 family metallopeptidase [Tannerella sp.]